MSSFVRAGQLHAITVRLVADMIDMEDRSAAEIASEAGIEPSRLRRILDGGDILTVPDIAALGDALDFQASDLVRLAERRAQATP